jgi:N-acetylmuramoyl-L-alanine amidase
VEYSCLNFIALGLAAESVTGKPLDHLANEILFAPLGLRNTAFRPELPPERFAWTERGNTDERRAVEKMGLQFSDWRTDFFPGQVHDGNAHYAMGGISGNAGLFSTAREVAILGEMWLNGGEYRGTRILSAALVAEATRDQTGSLNEARGLGWQLSRPGTEVFSSARLLSPRAFGHTGFTGTAIWIDPDYDLAIVLLTNRIHPSIQDGDADREFQLRRSFVDAVVRGLPASACAIPRAIS